MPVTALDALLPALADCDGRAVRTASLRHRHLVSEPALIVPFQIGGESFALAAVAWGSSKEDFNLLIVPDPRERALFYRRVEPFALWFDQLFQSYGDERDERTTRQGQTNSTALLAPQVIVPNAASAQLLGRIGRRLAYLDKSLIPVDSALIAAGRHLLFLRDRLRVAGQQLILALTDLVASHWATPQTLAERLSLPALAAWTDPPHGMHGFDAAQVDEVGFGVGPIPSGDDDAKLFRLVENYREAVKARDSRAETRVERKISQHWEDLVRPAWNLCWEVMGREQSWAEAPSTVRRWAEDRVAFTRHIDWQRTVGHRRVRPTPRQAAIAQYELETAASLVEAQEAIDDPLRMIPYVLRGEAIIGKIIRLDTSHQEATANGQMRTYPLVTVASAEPCLMPLGKELWWTEDSGGSGWLVHSVTLPARGATRWHVTLRRVTSSNARSHLPAAGSEITLSILRTNVIPPKFPAESDVPWTHRPLVDQQSSRPDVPLDGTAAEGEPSPSDAPLRALTSAKHVVSGQRTEHDLELV